MGEVFPDYNRLSDRFGGVPIIQEPSDPGLLQTAWAGFNLYNPFKMGYNYLSDTLYHAEKTDPNYDVVKHIPFGYEEYFSAFMNDYSDEQVEYTRKSLDEEFRFRDIMSRTSWFNALLGGAANVAVNPLYWITPIKGATTIASIGKSALGLGLAEGMNEIIRHGGSDTVTARESVSMIGTAAFMGGIFGGVFGRVRKPGTTPPSIINMSDFESGKGFISDFGTGGEWTPRSTPIKSEVMESISKEMGAENLGKIVNIHPLNTIIESAEEVELRGIIRVMDDVRGAMDELASGFKHLQEWETTIDDFKVQDENGFTPLRDSATLRAIAEKEAYLKWEKENPVTFAEVEPKPAKPISVAAPSEKTAPWRAMREQQLEEERLKLEGRIAKEPPKSINKVITEEAESIEKQIKNNEYEATNAEVDADLIAEQNKALAEILAAIEEKKIPLAEAIEANGLKVLVPGTKTGDQLFTAVVLNDGTIVYKTESRTIEATGMHAKLQEQLEMAGIDADRIADTGYIHEGEYISFDEKAKLKRAIEKRKAEESAAEKAKTPAEQWEYVYLEMDEFGNFTEKSIVAESKQRAKRYGDIYEMKHGKMAGSGLIRKVGGK